MLNKINAPGFTKTLSSPPHVQVGSLQSNPHYKMAHNMNYTNSNKDLNNIKD